MSLLLAGVLWLVVLIAVTGCRSQYLRFDERGRRLSISEIRCDTRPTEFERSLCETFDDPYDPQKVRLCVRYELLGELARRDGPGSDQQRLLSHLDAFHIVYDSARMVQVFREGLAELDRTWKEDRHTGMDREIELRAAQVVELKCFLPDSRPHFDELGKLIVLHGQCTVEEWTEKTMTVSFDDGMMYWIGEDDAYSHKVLLAAQSAGEMDRLKEKFVSSDNSQGGLPKVDDVNLDIEASARTRALEFDSWREIDVPAEGDALNFASINLHVIPTSYGDGAWNGMLPAGQDGPWDWSRCLIDFYVNAGELRRPFESDENPAELIIEYEVRRRSDSGFVTVAQESLVLGIDTPLPQGREGIAFRAVTLPFASGSDKDWGYHEFWLKASCNDFVTVRWSPFHVSEKSYKLLVLDSAPSKWRGIPSCMRIPAAGLGDELTVLIPYRLLPEFSTPGAFANLYLINNREIREGRVDVGGMVPLGFEGDSVGTFSPGELRTAAPASLVETFEISAVTPNGYLMHTFVVPREDETGEKLTRGTYTLGVEIVAGDAVISEAMINDLKVE